MPFSKHGGGGPMDEWSSRVQTLLEEMRRRSFCDFRPAGTWQPAINVYESRSAFHICVVLAGIDAAGVAVECNGARRVCVTGVRSRPQAPGLADPFSIAVMEIDEGPFQREIELPGEFELNALELHHDRGYVWITLPKSTR